MVRLGLPHRLKSYNGKSSRSASPAPSAESSLALRVCVVKARNLAAKDRGGTSDPYLAISLGEAKAVTHAVDKSLNPEWHVTFDLPIGGALLLDCVCWDKDRFGKDYLGEFEVSIDEEFANGVLVHEPKWFPLKSKRKTSDISGEVELQLSIVDTHNAQAPIENILERWNAAVAAGHHHASKIPDEDIEDGSDEADDLVRSDSGDKSSQKALKKKRERAYQLGSNTAVLGVLYLEIVSVSDLPPERNITRTGFDMDPFVVASLGKRTYRTKVVRHNLNPVFEEKLIFQVLKHEETYSFYFSVIDRDKLSGNDFVADCSFSLHDVIAAAPEADPETGLYHVKEPQEITQLAKSKSRFRNPLSRTSSATSVSKLVRPGNSRKTSTNNAVTSQPSGENSLAVPPAGGAAGVLPEEHAAGSPDEEEVDDLKVYTMALHMRNHDRWEDKHNPELKIRAKFVPYPALRQQFWRVMLKAYDADDSSRISKVELSTMLDTLGSTLKESTIDDFFKRFHQTSDGNGGEPELTFDQAVICLEDQLEEVKANAGRKQSLGEKIKAKLPDMSALKPGDTPSQGIRHTNTDSSAGSEPTTITHSASSEAHTLVPDTMGTPGEEGDFLDRDDLMDDKGEEHVIQISECPLCHQPRLNKRSDADIITHIATCASQDWRTVNNLVMGGFVTYSQAQRKWYSKVITKIGYGGYKLGANSANILVQDRITGQISEERMSVYVRLGIRLLYKGLKSREMEKKRIRKLLKSLSVKQGVKFDDPASASQIPAFIDFHKLDMNEVLLPLDQFKTFNEFFYRKLKEGERPCSAPDNSKIIVSPADCRTVVFNSIDDATRIWIKGREFSVSRLLGNAYPDDVARYNGGALGIFRLAPQDYHRFHIPVDGKMGQPKLIDGEYYTVNPMAIRSALDVYGENIRVCVPIDSVSHKRVMMICVGAMMVGSTVITRNEGDQVKRAEELGYFKFGGSTIILLFEPGVMQFDADLIDNSNGPLETLIRVGMSIGHSPEEPVHSPDQPKENVTEEEKLDAQRRIGGSLAEEHAVGTNNNPVPAMAM